MGGAGREDGRGCPGERWGKTLMLTTSRGAGTEREGPEQKQSWVHQSAPTELHPDSARRRRCRIKSRFAWHVKGSVPRDSTDISTWGRGEQGEIHVVCFKAQNQWHQPKINKNGTSVSSRNTLLTYFPAFVSLLRASLEMTWPQMSFMGGLLSEVCCLRMGQANTEWYQHFFPRSISICSYRGRAVKSML